MLYYKLVNAFLCMECSFKYSVYKKGHSKFRKHKPAQSKVSLYHLWNSLLQHVTESIVFELKWVESEFVSTGASAIVLG